MWHPEMCFTRPTPFFLSIYLFSLCFIWCPSLPGSPSIPTAKVSFFCFCSLLALCLHLHFSLPLPVMFFFMFCVCVSFSLIPVWNLCRSKQASHLVDMTHELPILHLSLLSFFSPHSLTSFHICSIRSSKGQPRWGHERHWECISNK